LWPALIHRLKRPKALIQLVTAPRADPPRSSQLTTGAGGLASRYTPHFNGEVLVRIDEQRESDRADSAFGTYAFQGARLMRYEGAPLEGEGTLLLEFDLQGQVISARHGDAVATDEQVSAIRTRAHLLRNHALAQHVSRTHPMQ
jgi:hypothetical protein